MSPADGEHLVVLAEGITALPPGKLATQVVYLEMTEPPRETVADAAAFELVRVAAPDTGWYRALYLAIGRDWLWFSRLAMAERELAVVLAAATTEVHVLRRAGEDISLLELDRQVPGDVEIAFFGLVPAAIGAGAGRVLMAEALRLAWGEGTRRVWLHTCAFDHPRALDFYRRSGFRPYRFALEIGDDPRLSGVLPRDAAPQVPLIDPA